MRAINIVGFKNTGKTTLTLALADTLEAQGLTVAIVKQSHHALDMPHTDTARFRLESKQKEKRMVLALGQDEAALFWGKSQKLTDLLPLIQADIVLIEGAKSQDFLPRIICLRPEDTVDNLAPELKASLALATYSIDAQKALAHTPHFQGTTSESLAAMAKIIIEKAFLLPRLNCKSCGFANCAEMAQALVAGTKKTCPVLDGKVELHINGRPIALNPFTARIMAGALQGMVRELKGVETQGQEQKLTFSCTL